MESVRQQKVARLILKEMADIFLKESRVLFGNVFISITVVRMSPDLSVAKLYLSIMLQEDKNAILKEIKVHTKELRKLLGERIRKQVRIIPEIIFYLDDNVDYANHMDDVLSKITIPKKEDENFDPNQYPGLKE
ncbi:ribosome-binding factor A [Cytophaga hutchinsonii]|jgi:ribosome-binding factor A|uniref:Ribosome-binding factor A n=1 Tax=Cytophaga hutchinsonii (strain ATCC 33406 / DSM 1761 / CIP 103989 / NBRC 15051 / NCIMB 9469 / D465) TaxID=269798 RepID=RBFA_CYTH3|nr:ribosome-binding factor A [Cytophaga hutchinsonii]Q11P01.1 RecName: Full=Ribosome-binding factor A [Cytophaga hutchinsonii ATCC 33406]ABG60862.1 ribosome-binding factor A [Cytophaga hutchinsonii ATCC 33406]SFY00106.1 ribosome-binding factor A [Cytophaga hutchinsonii ATCC 33406]